MKSQFLHQFVLSIAAASLSIFAASTATAQACAATVESTDQMQYNLKNIDVSKKCKEFTITLKHVGKMPKAAMGHNLAIAKTADMAAVNTDGITAGIANEYVKPKDTRVLAYTKMIGGGETTTTTLKVSALNDKDAYAFFCTFPGHASLMKGTLKLVP